MPLHAAFLDELTKIGRASCQRNKSRVGRRSMHVETMLRKEKEGSLYKHTKLGSYEEEVPWYTTALGSSVGAVLGKRALTKYPIAGTIAGLLAGTGLGLKSGKLIGHELDEPEYVSKAAEAVGIAVEDGKKRILTDEEAAQLAAAAGEIPLDVFQAISRNLERVNAIPETGLVGALPQVEVPILAPQREGSFVPSAIPAKFAEALVSEEDLARLYPVDTAKKRAQLRDKPISEVGKMADTVSRWLDSGYTEGERSMQNVPVTAKKKRGDSPTTDTASAYGMGSKMTPTWTPPETAIPSKLAEIGRLVKSPTETHPSRGEGIGPKRLGGEEAIFRMQFGGHDPRPITEVETDDAYSRA